MEGPGVKVISERLRFLEGKVVLDSEGRTKKFDVGLLRGKDIKRVFSYGKNLFIEFKDLGYLRIHFLMYGSYSVNEKIKDDRFIRLMIKVDDSQVYFYNCSIDLMERYDFNNNDILSDEFSVETAVKNLKRYEGYICDALLDQELFPGVGNIIKVEGLYRASIHPLSICKNIPEEKMENLVKEVRSFSFIFYKTIKENNRLKEYLVCYGRRTCPRCSGKMVIRRLGEKKRINYLCENCQILF
ncbi:MAG: DNA-formamidopyrimidine glycosylase family protein [Candidatus Caldarchaeales archaeon]